MPTPRSLLPLVFLVACGDKLDMTAARRMDVSQVSAPAATPAPTGQPLASATSTYWAAQKLIRTGEMRIQVRDVTKALKSADSVARAFDTFVAHSRTDQDAEGANSAEVVLRIPSEKFEPVFNALKTLGTVKNQGMAAQDVTKEYADLETRLAVKEQTVARLRSLLDNRSGKLADILEVERELARAVTELEQLKGERRYYDQQIALSTITLHLFERTPSRITSMSGPVADALRGSLTVLGNSVGAVIYVIVAIIPWALVVLALVWLVPSLRHRYLRRST